jgi:hypothetical protein
MSAIYVFFHFRKYYQFGRRPLGFLRLPEAGSHCLAQPPLGRGGFSHSDRFPSPLSGCTEEKGQNPGGGPRSFFPSNYEFMLLLPPSLRRKPRRLPPLRAELEEVTIPTTSLSTAGI